MARGVMRVLVTRPREDSEATAAKLKALGHEPVLAPLMEIRFRDGESLTLGGVQAILATSANGARAIARRTARRDVKFFAVGTQTAQAARDAGFSDVRSADGDGAALAQAAMRWAAPEDGALLHAAGADTRGDLAATLIAHGFVVRTETLYDAVAAARLPADVEAALRAGDLDAVLLFSPRGARVFATLVDAAGLRDACGKIAALCISRATAGGLEGVGFRLAAVAERPDQPSLLTLLERVGAARPRL
jgi:uroporphyrinogen-III synthase